MKGFQIICNHYDSDDGHYVDSPAGRQVHAAKVFSDPVDAMIYCDEEYDLTATWHAGDDSFGVCQKGRYSWDAFSIEIMAVPVGGDGN